MNFEELEAENKKLNAEVESSREKLRDFNASLNAMLYMLEDLNKSKADLEQSEKQLEEETEITKHLLMISEATAHTTNIDKLMEQAVHCTREIIGCDIVLSYLWDNSEKLFKPSHEIGLTHNLIPMFRTEPVHEEDVKDMTGGRVSAIIADFKEMMTSKS